MVRILDTPGIMIPKVDDNEIGLKLALTGAIRDEIVGTDILVEYLLYRLLAMSQLGFEATVAAPVSGADGGAAEGELLDLDLERPEVMSMAATGLGSGTWRAGRSPMDLLTALDKGAHKGKGAQKGKGAKEDKKRRRAGGGRGDGGDCATTAAPSRKEWPLDVDGLVELVAKASGAAGKRDEERLRVACRWVLKKYREGALGKLTLDDVR